MLTIAENYKPFEKISWSVIGFWLRRNAGSWAPDEHAYGISHDEMGSVYKFL